MRLSRPYKIQIEDASRLTCVAQFQRPLWKWMVAAAVGVIAALFLAGLLIVATPLRELLPGYMEEAQRSTTIEYLMRLDSLQEAYTRNQNFLDNLSTVLDTRRRPTDSTRLVVNPDRATTAALLPTSESEQKFMSMMEEREKYNISVLAPLAAEGMIFQMPVAPAVPVGRAAESTELRLRAAAGATVAAAADGTVLDTHYSAADRGFAVIVQHPKGFTSRCAGIGALMVHPGERVEAGQALGLARRSGQSGPTVISLRLWRNGDALIPWQFLSKGSVSRRAEETNTKTN